jgi:hypothetical protein
MGNAGQCMTVKYIKYLLSFARSQKQVTLQKTGIAYRNELYGCQFDGCIVVSRSTM